MGTDCEISEIPIWFMVCREQSLRVQLLKTFRPIASDRCNEAVQGQLRPIAAVGNRSFSVTALLDQILYLEIDKPASKPKYSILPAIDTENPILPSMSLQF